MQLKFDEQDFQTHAINSVVNLFNNMQITNISTPLIYNNEIIDSNIITNGLQLNTQQLLINLQQIQQFNNTISNANITNASNQDNQIAISDTLIYGDNDEYINIPNFSIEMETGTGKTYVYLSTIFELHQKYQLTKFIIVTPSDAIRIGVLKTLEITLEHFKIKYNNINYDFYRYDSSKPHLAKDFASNNNLQIMVMSIAAFNNDADNAKKKGNVIFEYKDTQGEYRLIDFISHCKPIVIIDEPQSVDNTINAKNAIKKLNPLFILRYSATHKQSYNLVYKLNAIAAYMQGLVKQIEVSSIEDTPNVIINQPYIKVININSNKRGLTIDLELDIKSHNRTITRKIIKKIPQGTKLQDITNNDSYDNYIIENFSLNHGLKLNIFDAMVAIGSSIGGNINQELQTNILLQLVITHHIKRELDFANQNPQIKVLSLLFIDKVASYRSYGASDNNNDGWLSRAFIAQFKNVLQTDNGKKYILLCKEQFKLDLTNDDELAKLHDGYFAKDTKGHYKDSKDNTINACSTYDLIMKDKEKLLNPKTPLRFIFSHSALKEGWDNPNVFQICVLQDSSNTFKRRQQIGRGLRLCVNSDGNRIIGNQSINTLTVISHESFKNFAYNLQNEYQEDANIDFTSSLIKNERDKIPIVINDKLFNNPNGQFKRLWDKINKRTIFKIALNSELLIDEISKTLNKTGGINKATIKANEVIIQNNELCLTTDGIIGKMNIKHDIHINTVIAHNINLITYIIDKTQLTKRTIKIIYDKLSEEQKQLFYVNPNLWLEKIIDIINQEKHNSLNSKFKNNNNSNDNNDGHNITYSLYKDLPLIKSIIKDEKYYYSIDLLKDSVEHGYCEHSNKHKDNNSNIFNVTNLSNDLQTAFNNKFVFNVMRYDSKLEIQFLENELSKSTTKLILKLPAWFMVNTPSGRYNPDWALLVTEKDTNNEDVYWIIETKCQDFVNFGSDNEKFKTACGKKHFEGALKIKYKIEDKYAVN